MGWCSGSEIAESLWDAVREYLPLSVRKDVAQRFVNTFENYDCDTMYEATILMQDAAGNFDGPEPALARNLEFEQQCSNAVKSGDYIPLRQRIEELKQQIKDGVSMDRCNCGCGQRFHLRSYAQIPESEKQDMQALFATPMMLSMQKMADNEGRPLINLKESWEGDVFKLDASLGPMLESRKLNKEQIAEITHEANRAYCSNLGDKSPAPWAESPQWMRDSTIKGVELHLAGHESGNKVAPEASHESWLKEKFDTGWKYGPVKDAEKKQHPCCLPYAALPFEQRMKDYIFGAIIEAIYNAQK